MGVFENSVALNPMVLLIIIPMKNGYFIGNIPNIFRQTHVSWLSVGSWSTQTSVSLCSSRSASTSKVSDSDSCSWWEQSNVIRCHWSGKISCDLEIFDCNQTGSSSFCNKPCGLNGSQPSKYRWSPALYQDKDFARASENGRTIPTPLSSFAHKTQGTQVHLGLVVWSKIQHPSGHLSKLHNFLCQNQKSTACLEILGMIPILSIIYHLVMTNSSPWKITMLLSSVNPGKPSISIRAIYTMAMLVITRRVYPIKSH